MSMVMCGILPVALNVPDKLVDKVFELCPPGTAVNPYPGVEAMAGIEDMAAVQKDGEAKPVLGDEAGTGPLAIAEPVPKVAATQETTNPMEVVVPEGQMDLEGTIESV